MGHPICATFLIYTQIPHTHRRPRRVFSRNRRFGDRQKFDPPRWPRSRTIFHLFSFFLSLHFAKRLCKTRLRAVDITRQWQLNIIYKVTGIPLSVRGENRVLVHCSARSICNKCGVGEWRDRRAALAVLLTYFWFSSLCIVLRSLLSNPSVTSASNTKDCTNLLSPEIW